MGKFILDENKEIIGYDCEECDNNGGFAYRDNGYLMWKPCKCVKIRESIGRLKMSGLGNLLKTLTFDNFKAEEDWQKDMKEKAINFVNSNNKWFVILGQSGIGKSHICTAISRELLKQGKSIRYMRWLDDGNKLKRNAMNSETYEAIIDDLKNVEVLYIDDFWKSDNNSKPSPADIKIANEILNYRYNEALSKNERLITIISSERTLEQLTSYDVAIAGRMVEMSKPDYLIEIRGAEKNYRLK